MNVVSGWSGWCMQKEKSIPGTQILDVPSRCFTRQHMSVLCIKLIACIALSHRVGAGCNSEETKNVQNTVRLAGSHRNHHWFCHSEPMGRRPEDYHPQT